MPGTSQNTPLRLELQSRHVFFLILLAILLAFGLFVAGMAFGKRLVVIPTAPAQNVQAKQLDCLDWLESYTKKKTSRPE